MQFRNKVTDLSIWLFVILLIVYFANALIKNTTHSFLCGDPYGAYLGGVSLLEDGDLDLRNQLSFNPSFAHDQMALGKDGEWFAVHDVALSALAGLLLFISSSAGILFICNAVMLAIAVVLGFKSCQNSENLTYAWVAALLIGISPVFIQTSYSYSWDVLGTFLLVTSWYLLKKQKILLAGIVWGLLLISRLNNIVTLPAYLFLSYRNKLTSDKLKSILIFTLGVIPSILALFLINIELFGGPMELSHKHWATGIEDKMLSISQFNRFTTPPFLGAFSILVHPTQGLLVNAPLVIFLFFMGLITFYKRNRTDFIALGCMYLLLFILYSGYTGTVFTPSRYFLAPLILSCEAVAYGIRFIFKNTDDIPKKS